MTDPRDAGGGRTARRVVGGNLQNPGPELVAGDVDAHRRMIDLLVTPLAAAGGDLLRTVEAYLEGGGALEACARALFVHPNTVRYRLRRVSELTGRSPTEPRDALVLRVALMAGRMDAARRPDRPA